jgi:RNA polymerase sigma-70 factor (family 1)
MPASDIFHECELMLQVAAGDEIAFGKLFAQYHRQLGAYIFRITDSVELAEEVVQDVFLKIWMSREALQGVKSFKAYLFVVSKNHALNCLRKVIKERAHKVEWHDSTINEIQITVDDVQDKYYCLIDEAINNLPPQQQKVYLLSRHQRYKYAEIAEQLGISHETVKKYLQIAVASITNYVQGHIDQLLLLPLFLLFH